MHYRLSFAGASALAIAMGASVCVHGQAFDCVHLNDENTNIFLTPDESTSRTP